MGFETAFAIVTAVVLASSAVVVGGLRFALRKWGSVWRKGLLIHAVNIVLDFVLFSNWPGAHIKMLVYSGFTNGSQLLLLLLIFAADMTRAVLHKKALPSYAPLAACAVLVLVSIGLARATVAADIGRAAIARDMLIRVAFAGLEHSHPDREIILALQRDFPDDAQRVFQNYILMLEQQHQQIGPGHMLPRLSYDEVNAVEKHYVRFLASAPDTALVRVTRANGAVLRSVAGNSDVCAAFASHVNRMTTAEAAAPVNDGVQVGELHAAMLDAERAGIDHPVRRVVSADAETRTVREFAASLKPEQRVRWWQLDFGTGPVEELCRYSLAFDTWLASRPKADVAAYAAYHYGAAQAASGQAQL